MDYKIYRNAIVDDCVIGKGSSVGDDSRLVSCKLGEHVRIDRRNYCQYSEIGRRTYTGCDTRIFNTSIGSFSSISWHVTVGGGEHKTDRISTHDFYYNRYSFKDEIQYDNYDRFKEAVEIGNDVWIGAGAVILRGVRIGHGAVIGANTVVTKDVVPYAVVVGNPGRVIKFRFDEKTITSLIELEWWNFSDSILKENFEKLKSTDVQDVINKLKQFK